MTVVLTTKVAILLLKDDRWLIKTSDHKAHMPYTRHLPRCNKMPTLEIIMWQSPRASSPSPKPIAPHHIPRAPRKLSFPHPTHPHFSIFRCFGHEFPHPSAYHSRYHLNQSLCYVFASMSPIDLRDASQSLSC